MIALRHLFRGIRHAWAGLGYVFRHEQNFRLQILMAILVLITMWLFRIPGPRAAVLVVVMMAVLVLEVVNSMVEKLVDLLKPRIHYAVGEIKNMMAGAVLLASIAAVVIGLIIFWPYVFG